MYIIENDIYKFTMYYNVFTNSQIVHIFILEILQNYIID